MIPALIAAAGRLLAGRAASAATGMVRGAAKVTQSAARGAAYNPAQQRRGQELQRVMDRLGVSAHKLKNPIQSLIDPFDQLAARSSKLSALVRLVNPGQANQADLAVKNLYSSIGKHLQPVLRGTTRLMDSLNRVISGLGPAIAPATEALEKFLTALGQTIEEMGPDAATVVHNYAMGIATVTDGMRAALPILKIVGDVVGFLNDIPGGGFLTGGILGGLGQLRRLLMGGNGDFVPNQFGRAVQPPSVATSSEQIYNPAALAALQASSGQGPKETVQDKQLSTQEAILAFLNKKWGGVAVGGGAGGLAAQAGNAVGQAVGPGGALGAGAAGMGVGILGPNAAGSNIGNKIGRGIVEALFNR